MPIELRKLSALTAAPDGRAGVLNAIRARAIPPAAYLTRLVAPIFAPAYTSSRGHPHAEKGIRPNGWGVLLVVWGVGAAGPKGSRAEP